MNFSEYVPQAIRTESLPSIFFQDHPDAHSVRIARILHASLGLNTEAAEYQIAKTNKNRKEEVGDIFWYLAVIDSAISLRTVTDLLYIYSDYDKELAEYTDLQYWTGELADVIKRIIFYKEPWNIINKKGWLPEHRIAMCFWGIMRWLENLSFDLSEILVDNLKKLAKRYPNLEWTFEGATDRNVEHELSHIQESSDLPSVSVEKAAQIKNLWELLTVAIDITDSSLTFESTQEEVFKWFTEEYFGASLEELKLVIGPQLTTSDVRVWHDGKNKFIKVSPNITTLFEETSEKAPTLEEISFDCFVGSIMSRKLTHGDILKFGSNFFSALDDYYSRNDCRVMSLAYKAGYTELMAMRPAETAIALKNIWAVIKVWGALHKFGVPQSDEAIEYMLTHQKELCLCPSLLKN